MYVFMYMYVCVFVYIYYMYICKYDKMDINVIDSYKEISSYDDKNVRSKFCDSTNRIVSSGSLSSRTIGNQKSSELKFLAH